MKKLLIPTILLLLLFTMIGCDQSIYQMKTLVVKNESDLDIYSLSIEIPDGTIDYRLIELETTPIIYSGDTKEYAIPYINNGEESPIVTVRAFAEPYFRSFLPTGSRGSISYSRISFLFSTSNIEDITLIFDENPEDPGFYKFSGSGSGFQELVDD